MSASRRKPVEPGCDGSVLCPVPGHVPARRSGGGLRFEHIVLTPGQRKTIQEQREHEHSWRFWGDDPYLICDCGAIQDALTGKAIKEGVAR